MTRHDEATLGGVALPEITGFVGDDGAVSTPDYTTFTQSDRTQPCPHCTYFGPHRVVPSTPLHHQRLSCSQCGRFLLWLPGPCPVAQEVSA